MKLGARYAWTDANTLEISGRFVEESLGSETIVCKFTEQNNDIRVSIEPKVPASSARAAFRIQPVTLMGTMVKIE